MYRDFIPIHHLHDQPVEKKEEPKEKEDCQEYKDTLDQLLLKNQELSTRIQELQEEKEKFSQELLDLKREKELLLEELAKRAKIEELMQNLKEEILKKIAFEKEKIAIELKELIVDAMKKLLDIWELPKEKALEKALKEFFELSLEIDGTLKMYTNPKNVETLKKLWNGLQLESIEVQILPREDLMEGELIIDSHRFTLVSKHLDNLEAILEEKLKDAKSLQQGT
ncbi:hypothetical protein [Thermocrinis minervae]|uniref:Flagellar assembly protein FliH n=1 Tax=Thermocrinis minervae TaxID=381751 RepID=A0A1M6QWD8_9AQUI|nr:hypothetical protein [Thermocrinis minervae]SHK24582.1 flagellar assembly protein FliH [Thermocrinis minervae]